EQEIQDISGKQILGIIETIKIKYNEGITNYELRITNESGTMNQELRIKNKKAKPEIAKGSTQSMEPTKENNNGKDKEKIVVKEMELKAKIDTGADLSSIDKNLAKELGYGEAIEEFDEAVKNIKIENGATKEILDEKIKDKLTKWGENYETVVIKSSHGISYRLLIKMNIILSGVEIISKMSITDRSNLEFPVIIGRKSLGRFLVDPSKKTKAVFGK
ncbi:MAG: RimK/LysX family protein, partial [Enterobacteriaceae bacterium]|nr:RimK/LysX family protein [Enterobacteriaceae bacterium]